MTRRDSSHDMFREALCGEGVSQRRCHRKGASGTGRRGRQCTEHGSPAEGGAASGLNELGSPCRLEGPGLAGPEAAGARTTHHSCEKTHGLDSGFKHTKASHSCPQILTQSENRKPAHMVCKGESGGLLVRITTSSCALTEALL